MPAHKSSQTLITTRHPKGRQIVSLLAAAVNKAMLPAGTGAQKGLIENGGAVQDEVVALLRRYAGVQHPRIANYSASAWDMMDTSAQCNRMRSALGRRFKNESDARPHGDNPRLPRGATQWAVVPRWRAIAPTYAEAVAEMFRLLAKRRRFSSELADNLSARYLRSAMSTDLAMDDIVTRQHSALLAIPVHFGKRHKGRSPEAVSVRLHDTSEFPLDTFSVAAVLVGNPEMLVSEDDLAITTGDFYSPDASEPLTHTTQFRYSAALGRVVCGIQPRDARLSGCATATGYVMPPVANA